MWRSSTCPTPPANRTTHGSNAFRWNGGCRFGAVVRISLLARTVGRLATGRIAGRAEQFSSRRLLRERPAFSALPCCIPRVTTPRCESCASRERRWRANVQSPSRNSSMASILPLSPRRRSAAHELRWTYVRGSARQQCTLALGANEASCEFRVIGCDGRRPATHTFSETFDALEWHSLHEAALIASGYSLEFFDATVRIA